MRELDLKPQLLTLKAWLWATATVRGLYETIKLLLLLSFCWHLSLFFPPAKQCFTFPFLLEDHLSDVAHIMG